MSHKCLGEPYGCTFTGANEPEVLAHASKCVHAQLSLLWTQCQFLTQRCASLESQLYAVQAKQSAPKYVNYNFVKKILSTHDFTTGEDYTGSTFETCNIGGIDFSGAKLCKTNFYAAKADRETKFKTCNLQHANFTGANLQDVDFTGANMDHAIVDKANLDQAIFEKVDMSKCDIFKAASAVNVVIRNGSAKNLHLADGKFLCAQLHSCDLSGTILNNFTWQMSQFSNVLLVDAQLSANLLGASKHAYSDWKNTVLRKCDFTGASFDNVKFDDAKWFECIVTGSASNCTFSNCLFSNSDCLAIKMENCNMQDVKSAGCKFEQAKFTACKFNNADFSGENLQAAVFDKCDLSNANFEKANLKGAKFLDCNLSGANFAKADMQKYMESYYEKNAWDDYDTLYREVQSEINCCNVAGTNFSSVLFGNTKFKQTPLSSAITSNCDLSAAQHT